MSKPAIEILEQKGDILVQNYTFAEFFSGGGMVTAGLGSAWRCVMANDNDTKKCHTYRQNWPNAHLHQCDISDLPNEVLHRQIDLYWASSPCQDFSLAGTGTGLSGRKSSAFLPWITQVKGAVENGFAPKIIAFENVVGLLSSNTGRDFRAVVDDISSLGYRVGAQIIDAKNFLPHSRPRLFVVGIHNSCQMPYSGAGMDAQANQIKKAFAGLPLKLQEKWLHWNLDVPVMRKLTLQDIVEKSVGDDGWFPKEKTTKLIDLMNELHLEKLQQAKATRRPIVGTIYKRGRPDEMGNTVQRAELRLDGIAGCLRTPGGGSSRQTVISIEGEEVRARLLTTAEAARLMGLPKGYKLPSNYNDAYRLMGDGVAVPVVRYLAAKMFEPILDVILSQKAA